MQVKEEVNEHNRERNKVDRYHNTRLFPSGGHFNFSVSLLNDHYTSLTMCLLLLPWWWMSGTPAAVMLLWVMSKGRRPTLCSVIDIVTWLQSVLPDRWIEVKWHLVRHFSRFSNILFFQVRPYLRFEQQAHVGSRLTDFFLSVFFFLFREVYPDWRPWIVSFTFSTLRENARCFTIPQVWEKWPWWPGCAWPDLPRCRRNNSLKKSF